MPATILIGVGGTGINTLLEVNKLLSGDLGARINLARNIYYIAVDTDDNALSNFRGDIEAQMGGAPAPYIHTILLSRDVTHLEPFVRRYFIDPFQGDLSPAQKKAKERMYAHWWIHPKNGPFMARRVRDVKLGAGQCPPVSFFLAWKDLEEIGDGIQKVIDSIQSRRPGSPVADGIGDGLPLSRLRVYIVSGLAGGTGRGAWHLLALKLREAFSHRAEQPSPIGFFVDSSVYKNVMKLGDQIKTQLKVNSITGISELTCWMRRSVESPTKLPEYSYVLPSMKKPVEGDSLDVNVNLVSSAGNPVDGAYLFFDRGRAGILPGPTQCFQMVGGIIYALITRRELGAVDINSGAPFWGGASASYEVDILSLRTFYESMAKAKVLDVLQKIDKGSVQNSVEEVLDGSKLEHYLDSVFDPREFEENGKLGANLHGSFLQRVNYYLLEENKSSIDRLIGALSSQKKDESIEIARELDKSHSERVDSAFQKTLENVFGGKTPSQLVQEGEEKLFNRTGSLVDILEFRRAISNIIKEEVENLPEEGGALGKISVKRTVEKCSGREFPNFWTLFTQPEISQIIQTARKKILLAGFSLVRVKYLELLKEILSENENKISIYEEILEGIKKLKISFERGARQSISAGKNLMGGVFDYLFSDSEEPEKAIPKVFEDQQFVRRYLKPPMAKNKELDLLEISPSEEVVGFLRRSVREWDKKNDSKEMRLRHFMDELKKVVEVNTALPLNFLEENFSVLSVIDKLRAVWEKRFNAIKGNQNRFDEVRLRFEQFFGVSPDFDQDGNVVLPETAEFLTQMAITLGGICLPYWEEVSGEMKDDHLDMILPWSENETRTATDIAKEIKEVLSKHQDRGKLTVEVFYLKGRGVEKRRAGNSFVMMGCVRQGVNSLSHINSLNYWKIDPTLTELLNKAEEEDAETIFDEEKSNGGLGFVDPTFVREPFRSLRWRPWVQEKEKRGGQGDKIISALAYALFPGFGEFRGALERVGWPMPLLKIGVNQQVRALRRNYIWDEAAKQGAVNPLSPWKEDDLIEQRLYRVKALFEGEDEDKKRASFGRQLYEKIDEEAEVFWGKVAPLLGLSGETELKKTQLKEYISMLSGFRDEATDDKDRFVLEEIIKFVQGMI